MKKLLGISLVAVLAATPLMAMAAPVGTGSTPVSFGENASEADVNAATATNGPKFQLMEAHDNDVNAASAGYVKGAYNAAIKAVNAVDDRIDEVASGKQDKLTEGNGIDITNNVVSAVGDGTTIAVDAEHNIHIVDGGVGTTQLGDNAVKTAKIENGAVTVGKIASEDMVQGTGDYAALTDLTSQGYVDQKVANLNISGYAKKEGVEQTIKNVTLSQGTVTNNALTGDIATTSGTIATIMTTWGSDTDNTPITGITGVGKGNLASNVTVAAPTINANSVVYAEPTPAP